jgi:G:T-mismatch repair DNA endonuclease (very short patch repair protein)
LPPPKKIKRAVPDDVIRALSELHEWNTRGRYPVEVVWKVDEQREMTLAEIVECLARWITGEVTL